MLINKLKNSVSAFIKKPRANPQKFLKYLLVFFSIIFPIILSLQNILSDTMAFWFDPARDFLLALNNLKKPTLIGQPTGIPGLFYGPYWIWLISFGLLFSWDPRIVTVLILTIPYLTFFPYLLYRLRSKYEETDWCFLWLLFYFAFSTYANSLWNLHPAPLILLFLIYLIINVDFSKLNKPNLIRLFILGVVSGLLINFHFSLGLAILFSTFIFLVMKAVKFRFQIKSFFSFLAGLLFSFSPFLLFEFRHGFNQIKTLVKTFTDAVFYNTSAVGQVGFSKDKITQVFFERFFKLINLQISYKILFYLLIILGLYLFYKSIKREIYFTKSEGSFFLFLVLSGGSILALYLTSKNPVWEYHFIGVEVLFLLFLGLIIRKILLIRFLFMIWVIILIIMNVYRVIAQPKASPYSLSSLQTKKYVVDTIYQDAGKKPFTIFAYSPSIYTYDYDYIFKWFAEKKYFYLPNREKIGDQPVYLIIPKVEEPIKEDFINYKTPSNIYKTDKAWDIDDGTTIIKRLKSRSML